MLSGSTIGTNAGSVVINGTISNTSVTSNSGTLDPTNFDGLIVVTNSGTITGDSLSNSTIGTNSGNVNVSGDATNVTVGTLSATGSFTVVGTLSSLDVTTLSGSLSAGHIGSLSATNAPGTSTVFTLNEGGVIRSLVLEPATTGGVLPQFVNYYYDHNTSGDAQLTMSVNDGNSYPTGNSYDVELLSSSARSGFDLAALYNAASTPAHIRNVLIEGSLVPSAGDASRIGVTSSVGGIQLPRTALASVGIMGNAKAGSVNAASIQAVSFASITEPTSNIPVAASSAKPNDAAQLLTSTTAIVQANSTFLAAAGQTANGQSQPVALFLDTGSSHAFNSNNVLIGNQGGIVGSTGPVLAQVTATGSSTSPSTIQTINLTGTGGSIQTAQLIANSIASSGALGDLTLQASQGIVANITAPSIFGNIAAPTGGISGIIQTTAGNIGRLLTTNGIITGVTSIQANSAFTGTILSAADLISQINVNGGSTGTIAAGGNLGYLQKTSAGAISRFGGLSINGGLSGDVAVLGNMYGDILINGGLNGRIAAQGAPNVLGAGRQGILDNILINGGVSSTGAIVSGGEIGDAGLGTDLAINGAPKGIIAAVGSLYDHINGTTKFASIFSNVGNPNSSQYAGGANLGAIDAIFSGLTLDDLTIGQLSTLLANLNRLHVGSNGNLSDS
jgi:hypothetical protein